MTFGVAPGAPQVATVASSAGLVDLFNSAASQTLLKTPSNASLHEAYYKAFLGLNSAAKSQTMVKPFGVGKVATGLLGRNLSSQLVPTSQDDVNYGVSGGTPTVITEIAHSLCTAVKAFKLGLTSSLVIPAFRDDPHGIRERRLRRASKRRRAGQGARRVPRRLRQHARPVVHVGDARRQPRHDRPRRHSQGPHERSGWPDGTPGNSNWLYVFGNGYLKTGWFGGIDASGNVTGWDPATGKDVPGQSSATTAQAAAAAAAYAVAKGDMRRVQDFYRGGEISGVINAKQM